MGHIVPTQAGGYRANWRDAAGRQRARTFHTKREAKAYLAEVETAVSRGLYVDPHAGRMRFGAYAARWLNARNDEITTAARDASLMRNHVIARWGTTPLTKIDRVPRARKGEADVDRVLLMCVTGQEMEVGPLEPSCRRWLETTAYCAG